MSFWIDFIIRFRIRIVPKLVILKASRNYWMNIQLKRNILKNMASLIKCVVLQIFGLSTDLLYPDHWIFLEFLELLIKWLNLLYNHSKCPCNLFSTLERRVILLKMLISLLIEITVKNFFLQNIASCTSVK